MMSAALPGEQVRSLGAKFLELEINAEGQGGYARELTAEEKVMEQQMVSLLWHGQTSSSPQQISPAGKHRF